MALTDKLTDIADAIRAKTGSSSTMTLDEMPTNIANIPTGVSNVYTTTYTLSEHNSGNVSLCTLPDSVYAHKDDDNFTVVIINTTPTSIQANDDYNIMACNNTNLPKQNGSYTVYGKGLRKSASSVTTGLVVYYPPNSPDNSLSLGGIGKFWMNGKVLTYKSSSYFLSAGTHQIVIFW